MSVEKEKIMKKVILVCFKVLSWKLHGKREINKEKSKAT